MRRREMVDVVKRKHTGWLVVRHVKVWNWNSALILMESSLLIGNGVVEESGNKCLMPRKARLI